MGAFSRVHVGLIRVKLQVGSSTWWPVLVGAVLFGSGTAAAATVRVPMLVLVPSAVAAVYLLGGWQLAVFHGIISIVSTMAFQSPSFAKRWVFAGVVWSFIICGLWRFW